MFRLFYPEHIHQETVVHQGCKYNEEKDDPVQEAGQDQDDHEGEPAEVLELGEDAIAFLSNILQIS